MEPPAPSLSAVSEVQVLQAFEEWTKGWDLAVSPIQINKRIIFERQVFRKRRKSRQGEAVRASQKPSASLQQLRVRSQSKLSLLGSLVMTDLSRGTAQ